MKYKMKIKTNVFFTSKLKKIGGSYHIVVPFSIRKRFNLIENDILEVQLIEINRDRQMIRYKCKKCGYVFDSDDDIPYCPACNSEDLEIIAERDENN